MYEDPHLHPSIDAWSAVEASFGALGRAVVVLDSGFRVMRASATLDAIVCEGTRERLQGRPIGDLVGSQVFVPGDELHRELSRGRRIEGRQAFIKCSRTGAQLVSLSVAPLPASAALAAHPQARFLVVLRVPEPVLGGDGGHTPAFGLVARSPAMLHIVALIEALHESEATVLITGESGTGKEVVARAIHGHSTRALGPFVAVNTGAIPPALLESELFGHVKGAFTGAVRDRRGSVELAAGGTLFLDEIGDMPLDIQVKLLRVLQDRTYQRLGDSTARPMDVRFVAATHVDLASAVKGRSFREDLYYRLRVVPIHVPPLRDRPDDVELLAGHLLSRIMARMGRSQRLSAEALELLKRHPWPGNVRQLENALEYAIAVCREQTIRVEHLPPEVRGNLESDSSYAPQPWADEPRRFENRPPDELRPAAPVESEGQESGGDASRILSTLEKHRWNRNAAAEELGMSRTTLWRRMRALGLD